MAVVDEDALGEVGLGEAAEALALVGAVGRHGAAVVGLGARHGVGQAARGVLPAVQDVDEGLAAVLAGQVGKDDGRDVGVVDDEAGPGIVEDDDGVFLPIEEGPEASDPRTRVLSVLELEDLFVRSAPDLSSLFDFLPLFTIY